MLISGCAIFVLRAAISIGPYVSHMADERRDDAPTGGAAAHVPPRPAAPSRRAVGLVIVVAALGYFVDIFDLLLFALVRRTSLTEILGPSLEGKSAVEVDKILSESGVLLDNILQTTGLLVGGLVWARSPQRPLWFDSLLLAREPLERSGDGRRPQRAAWVHARHWTW